MASRTGNLICKEIEVPVPWGHVSGKAWGENTDIPVVVLHGLQDNSGSFDYLIPLLPKGFHYICLDFPGHGKSSSFPPVVPLDYWNFALSVKLVVDYLELSSFIIMAHSLGAQVGVIFSALYPESIVKLILLDGIVPSFIKPRKTATFLRHKFDQIINFYKSYSSKIAPVYTYDEALNRLVSKRRTKLTDDAAKTLMHRNLIKLDDGYRFSTDQLLKLRFVPPLTVEMIQSILFSVKCPILLIIARETAEMMTTVYNYGEKMVESLENVLRDSLEVELSVFVVEGNHDVHLNNPGRISGRISSFLLRQKSKL